MSNSLSEKLNKVGLKVPHILLPNKNVNLSKFSCIAADQYTQSTEYWERVMKYVGENPSTLDLIYPEAILEKESNSNDFDSILSERIDGIRSKMTEYVSDGIYEDIGECFIYVERQTTSGIRKGLVVAVDLNEYDYNKGAKSLMRATELTVKERLVVRKQIREKASLDMPHILVLINDKENIVFDEVKNCDKELVYDFDLMEDSGHIKGYKITKDIERILDKLCILKDKANDGLLYAVGDGNHSLATAKACYEKLKETMTEEEYLAMLCEEILNYRVVLMDICRVLVAGRYAVTGNDSSVHSLCRAHDSRNDLLSVNAVYVCVVQKSLSLKH